MAKFYKNWFVHNVLAHPAMQILNMLECHDLARVVHDSTLPPEETNHDS